ncbi:hypothetical protein DPB93_25620 [Salmonella enterica subsp. salamae]|nr:hypothetical protein [Salmonella enterica subsp. salamae]
MLNNWRFTAPLDVKVKQLFFITRKYYQGAQFPLRTVFHVPAVFGLFQLFYFSFRFCNAPFIYQFHNQIDVIDQYIIFYTSLHLA